MAFGLNEIVSGTIGKNEAALIQSLAHDAQVEAGKCTPRCLRKLYLQTQERILHNISTLAREEYEKLLRSEQEKTGWNA